MTSKLRSSASISNGISKQGFARLGEALFVEDQWAIALRPQLAMAS
jgi:hypothetical protein